jgi:hypothetical protein
LPVKNSKQPSVAAINRQPHIDSASVQSHQGIAAANFLLSQNRAGELGHSPARSSFQTFPTFPRLTALNPKSRMTLLLQHTIKLLVQNLHLNRCNHKWQFRSL